ncbi:MAG: thiamine diphosphokinase [Oscillospiraceae bacterium]|nr:thiamine diphosphokinase [Oscillospiraceae bacterium]
MRAVIITGGSMTDYSYLRQFIRSDDYIIAADSGYLHAKCLMVTPDVLLGDFDSLAELPEGIPIYRFPAKKNLTDTELAVNFAREQGYRDFLLLGATGSRMDHTLSNILLLSALRPGETGAVVDEHNQIWFTDSELSLSAEPGTLFSLIPLATCEGVTTTNLAYPLHNATLLVGQGVGVSNVVLKSPANVTLSAGALLVMLCKD